MRAAILFIVGLAQLLCWQPQECLPSSPCSAAQEAYLRTIAHCIGMHLVTLTVHSIASCSGHHNLCSYGCRDCLKPSQPWKGSWGSPSFNMRVEGNHSPRLFVGGGCAAVLVLMSFQVLLSSGPALVPWDFAACGTAHSLKCNDSWQVQHVHEHFRPSSSIEHASYLSLISIHRACRWSIKLITGHLRVCLRNYSLYDRDRLSRV